MPIVIECVLNLCIKMFYNILKGISIFRSAVHLFDKKIILNGKTFSNSIENSHKLQLH